MTKYLTITGKTDGFGAQYQSLMSGIAYCAFKNYVYVHTPFKSIAHEECAASLNRFTGVKSDHEIDIKTPDIIEPYISKVHYSKTPDIFYTSQVLKKIREMYYSSKKPDKCKHDIAIHIRRGDVDQSTEPRYTGNEFYFNLISMLEKKYPDHTIGIYSEGQNVEFGVLNSKNVSFHLGEDIEQSFHALVTAKVLVTSKSSFSYSAALLSEGIVHYIPFWHKPLSHWTVLSVQMSSRR